MKYLDTLNNQLKTLQQIKFQRVLGLEFKSDNIIKSTHNFRHIMRASQCLMKGL